MSDLRQSLAYNPFDYVEWCEPDCTPERHAYHQGQWDMAVRICKRYDVLPNPVDGDKIPDQALSQIKAWIEKKMPKKIRWTIGEQKQFSTKVEDSVFYQAGYNQAIDDLRQQLREETGQ